MAKKKRIEGRGKIQKFGGRGNKERANESKKGQIKLRGNN